MSGLPNGWMSARLDEAAEVNPRKNVTVSSDQLITFVPMAAVDELEGKIRAPFDRRYGEVSKGFTHFHPCMENGKAAIAQGLTNNTGVGSTEFHVFRSSAALMPDYLWRYVRQLSFREDAKAQMSGAVGQQRVPTDYLKACEIPLPPLPEQKRIVEKVDGLTARTKLARAELDRIPTLIARYKQRLLSLAFSGELTADWRELNKLPSPTHTRIDDLTDDLKYGTAQKCFVDPHGIAVLRIPNVKSGGIDLTDLKYTDLDPKELAKLRLADGDILIVRSNGSVDLVGRPALVSGDAIGMAYAGYLIRMRPKAAISPRFASLMLEAPEVRRVIEEAAKSTSGVHNVNAKQLGALKLPIFHLDEQCEIVRRIEAAFKWLDRVSADHTAAAKLLPKLDAAILAKAFHGELVPQDPNDEPASALLERIKANTAKPAPKARRKQASSAE